MGAPCGHSQPQRRSQLNRLDTMRGNRFISWRASTRGSATGSGRRPASPLCLRALRLRPAPSRRIQTTRSETSVILASESSQSRLPNRMHSCLDQAVRDVWSVCQVVGLWTRLITYQRVDYAVFAHSEFEPNDYANAILAGEPYPPQAGKSKPVKTTFEPANEDISVAIQKLNFSIDDVEKQLKNVVCLTSVLALNSAQARISGHHTSRGAARTGCWCDRAGGLPHFRQAWIR